LKHLHPDAEEARGLGKANHALSHLNTPWVCRKELPRMAGNK
jgi:hypothetical protein